MEKGLIKSFVLRSDTTPIFAKTFNPADTNVLNASTGKFSIDNHFFSNGEELIYTPQSTFVGVGSVPMTYKNGSVIAELPTQVLLLLIMMITTSQYQLLNQELQLLLLL